MATVRSVLAEVRPRRSVRRYGRDGGATTTLETFDGPREELAFLSATRSGPLVRELERRGYRVFPAARVERVGATWVVEMTADELRRDAA